jgi:hypothetical protein
MRDAVAVAIAAAAAATFVTTSTAAAWSSTTGPIASTEMKVSTTTCRASSKRSTSTQMWRRQQIKRCERVAKHEAPRGVAKD